MNLSEYKKIHCIGIGGIGLSGIAEILLSRGHQVTGSDMRESDITEKLIGDGARIYLGHQAKNVEGADLVVYTVAVGDDNPELARAKELGIPTITRAQALGALMEEYDSSIAISGTHGKTTTTAMIALVLKNAGKDPTISVGGNLDEIGGNFYVGGMDYFVTEACEYRDSFLELKPNIEIILNIDSDHLDYFKDVDHIARSFDRFAKLVPDKGTVIAYDANPFVRSVIQGLPNAVTFGFSADSDYYATDISFDNEGMPGFDVNHGGQKLCRIDLSVPGEHNILNSLAAFACCHILGIDVDSIVSTLHEYRGIHRRFDVLGKISGDIRIIDDYAHHPTEIRATLEAAKNYPHNKIWCVFQPHTYTRTKAFLKDFARVLTKADHVIIAEIYAAREPDTGLVSSEDLAGLLKEAGTDVYYIKTFREIEDFLRERLKGHDLLITMGAGNVVEIGEDLLRR